MYMDSLTLAMVVVAIAVFVLLAGGVWIGLAIGGAGMLLYLFFIGGSFYPISILQFNVLNSITWTSMPLFIFMGIMVFKCGLGEKLYKFASASVGVFPGGLLHTNIISCAIFAACTGSSVACAATMGSIAIPELKKRGYDKRLVLGSLASAGTLGILIPPSVSFIVYGAVVGESVGKLFIAGIFPGLMLTGLFMLYIAVACIASPAKAPGRERFNIRVFWIGLWQFIPVGLLILLVLGAIYLGVATPTESAALGSVGAVVLAAIYRKLTWDNFSQSVVETVSATGMIFLLVIGCQIMSMALADLKIPATISQFMADLGLGKGAVFIGVVIMYLILGCFIDALSMVLLTLPVTYPLMMGLGFDSLWFGVVITLLCEIGQVTPPVGVNLFVIQGISRERLSDVALGSLPFVIIMVASCGVLYFFPEIATWLPTHMTK
jgi:C4-dicarboxylate transporter DctM subunit